MKIGSLKSAVDRDAWIKELAEYSGVSEQALSAEFQEIGPNVKKRNEPVGSEIKEDRLKNMKKKIDRISYRLLVLGFTHDDFFSILIENKDWFPLMFRKVIDSPGAKEAAILELEAGLEAGRLDKEKIGEEVKELLKYLKIEAICGKQQKIREIMRNESDEKKIEEMAVEFQRLAMEVDRLKKSR